VRTKILAVSAAGALALAAGAVPALGGLGGTVAAVQVATLTSGSGPGQNVSANVAPSWQTNGTVWAIASHNGIVYVGGGFTSVRPPGAAPGNGEVARTGLAAFNASTGALITSFNPKFTGVPSCSSNSPCGITALRVSPDGATLYVGGSFTGVNGSFRNFAAAFSTATGALLSNWKPAATGPVHAIAVSPDSKTVYLGGDFTKLDGQPRTKAGAVSAADGSLTAWAPNLNGAVTSIAVAPDGSRVLVGGYFTQINGVTQQAIGSTNPATGANEPWAATIEPSNPPACVGVVKDIVVSGGTAYIASEGTGNGCFDGDFAARISDGALLWQSDCLGATQSLVIINGWLYKGSHAHDCAYAPSGFPQVRNASNTGWVDHRLLTQSLTNGVLGHWTPNTNGNQLGPRVMATDGSQLFLGGDFTTVNRKPQQGFARFAPTPDTTGPFRPSPPIVRSTSAGVASLTFTGVSDPDDGTLMYRIYRDGSKTRIATVTATSWPWGLPVLHFRDTGLKGGSKHTYAVSAGDGIHFTSRSLPSAPVVISKSSPALSYWQTVLKDHPSFLWKLGEKSGGTASDASPHGFTGIYESGTTKGAAGPITGDPTTATTFNGRTGLVTAAHAVAGPQNFSIECWFKTSTSTGGKLVGFGSSQTGLSTSYDRSLYMMNDGQVTFGVFSGSVQAIESPRIYNDGKWHYVVATIGPAGMALYIDGSLIGTNPTTTAQSMTGYWRVGGDNLAGAWNLDFWHTNSQGTTEPYSFYVAGTIGAVAVYPSVLSQSQVSAHYAANALSH
jgi:Concanavalin A-like lectin/glucanases superfamily